MLLQAVRGPVKSSDPALRAKQQPEAAALEGEVYAALEATPDDGRAFVEGEAAARRAPHAAPQRPCQGRRGAAARARIRTHEQRGRAWQ